MITTVVGTCSSLTRYLNEFFPRDCLFYTGAHWTKQEPQEQSLLTGRSIFPCLPPDSISLSFPHQGRWREVRGDLAHRTFHCSNLARVGLNMG